MFTGLFIRHRRKNKMHFYSTLGFPGDSVVKNLPTNPGDPGDLPGSRRSRRSFCVRKIPWSRKWQPIPVFLPGKFHGQRSLLGCSLWVTESDRAGHMWCPPPSPLTHTRVTSHLLTPKMICHSLTGSFEFTGCLCLKYIK